MEFETKCHVILIRHGETHWNAEGRYQGWTDIALNENGQKQAEKLAELYRDYPIDAIYSSTLIRAKETAAIIKGKRQLPLFHEEDLREGSYGCLEGMKLIDIGQKYHRELAAASRLPSQERMHFRLVPDQETGDELARRASAALKKIASRHLGKMVLAVTHGGVMRSLLVSVAELEYSTIYIHNGGSVSLLANADSIGLFI